MKLDTDTWKPFNVGRIFTMANGKGITQEEISDNSGDFIAVQSGEDNNGVIGKIDLNYCKKMNYIYSEEPCLTIAVVQQDLCHIKMMVVWLVIQQRCFYSLIMSQHQNITCFCRQYSQLTGLNIHMVVK